MKSMANMWRPAQDFVASLVVGAAALLGFARTFDSFHYLLAGVIGILLG